MTMIQLLLLADLVLTIPFPWVLLELGNFLSGYDYTRLYSVEVAAFAVLWFFIEAHQLLVV